MDKVNKEEIREMLKKGMYFKDICKEVGVSYPYLRKVLDTMDIPRLEYSTIKVLEENAEEVEFLVLEMKTSVAELSERYGVSDFTVRSYLSKNGLPKHREKTLMESLLGINRDYIIEKLNRGELTNADIAHEYGVPETTVQYFTAKYRSAVMTVDEYHSYLLEGKMEADIMKDYGLTSDSLFGWRQSMLPYPLMEFRRAMVYHVLGEGVPYTKDRRRELQYIMAGTYNTFYQFNVRERERGLTIEEMRKEYLELKEKYPLAIEIAEKRMEHYERIQKSKRRL